MASEAALLLSPEGGYAIAITVSLCVCLSVCLCVCVCVRERERETAGSLKSWGNISMNILLAVFFTWKTRPKSNRSNKLCAWRHNMPRPSPPRGRPSASRAATHTQRSSTFSRRIRSHADAAAALRVKAALSKAAWWPWPLTFWPWKWCPSHVWRGLSLWQFWSSLASPFST